MCVLLSNRAAAHTVSLCYFILYKDSKASILSLCECLSLHTCVCVVRCCSRGRGCGAASSGAGGTAGSWPAAGAERPAETAASPSFPSPCTSGTGSQRSSAAGSDKEEVSGQLREKAKW